MSIQVNEQTIDWQKWLGLEIKDSILFVAFGKLIVKDLVGVKSVLDIFASKTLLFSEKRNVPSGVSLNCGFSVEL